MDGGFNIESLLSQAAQGNVPAPAAIAPPSAGSTTQPTDIGFDVESALKQTSQGKLQYTQPPVGRGVGQNFVAGANRTIFGALGAPVDLATRAINDITANPISGYKGVIQGNPVGGSTWLEQQWQRLTGTNPEDIQPTNEAERVAAATGGAVAQIPIMGAGGAALEAGATAPVVQSVGRAVQQSSGLRSVAPVAVGAATGQAAEDVAPEPLKPVANVVGNLAGAGGMAGVQEGLSAGKQLIGRQVGMMGVGDKQAIGGVSATAPQVQAAAEQVKSALGPEGLTNLDTQTEQLVPGSQPTTAQVAQTPGAVALEKAHRVATPEPFIQRAQDQNAARLTSVQGLAPTDAQPGAVGDLFRQQLAAIDAQGQQAVSQARGNVQQVTGALGGTQSTAAYGDQTRAALQAAKEPVHANTQRLWNVVDPDGTWALPAPTAKSTAQQLMGEISPTAQTDNQETSLLQRVAGLPDVVKFGDLGQIRADINAATRRLSGTPGMDPNVRRLTILKQSVDQSISDALDGRAAQEAQAVASGQMAPEQTIGASLQREAREFSAARNAATATGQQTPNGGGGAGQYAGAGSAAVSGVRGAEVSAAGGSGNAAGAPGLPGQAQSPLGTNAPSTLRLYRGEGGPLMNSKGGGNWFTTDQSKAQQYAAGGGRLTYMDVPYDAEHMVHFARIPGAPDEYFISQQDLPALAAKGVSPKPFNPNQANQVNLTPEHAAAYRAATNATRNEKQTFGQGGVGQVLRPGRNGAEFAVEPGAVPSKIFTRGPTEPGEVERFITAVGGPDRAAQIGQETLANELRQTGIIRPDGTVDADRFATWQARRQPTIQQFPGLGDRFSSAEAAQRSLDDVTAAHTASVHDFQNGVAKNFLHDDPQVAVRKAFGSGNPAATFTQLVRQVRGNPDAEAGLKRAVVDFITEKTRSATPAGEADDFQKSAVFRNFIRQNNGALKALFGGQGVQNLDMVAADLRRQAQQTTATAGPDTAQKIMVAQKKGLGIKEGAHLTALAVIGDQLGEVVSHALGGGPIGMLGGPAMAGAGYYLHSLRQAGIQTVNDLVREAMLHPNVARELMTKAQGGQIGPVASQRIGRALQASLAINTMQQQREKQ